MASTNTAKPFYKLINSPIRFRAFLFSKLPAAFFSGLKLQQLSDDGCVITVPYSRFTQNPFRSTYFACLAMAAEMSTGILVMANVYGRKPAVSMLVLGMESKFSKKATGLTYFTCNDAAAITQSTEAAITTGEAQTIKIYSKGTDGDGLLIAEFWITWTLKAKN